MIDFAETEVLDDADASTDTLGVDEREDLERHEETIERSLKSFVEVGEALQAIRGCRLYRETHKTFEGYCRERWDMSKRHVDRLIAASDVVANLGPMGPKPIAERQVRPLSGLTPDQQREAWERAVETAPDGKVTAKHVESVVREYRGGDDPPSSKDWSLDDAVEFLGSKLYEISQRWPEPYLEVMARQLHSLADELLEYGELRS